MKTEKNSIEEQVEGFTERFVKQSGGSVESVVFSPFPFVGSQLLIVCKEQVLYLHNVMMSAHQSDPPDIVTHWLRQSELRQLSLPDVSAGIQMCWPLNGGYPGWSYWLRYKGRILWGSDIRKRIPLPENPRHMLEAVLVGNMSVNREQLFLRLIEKERFEDLINILARLACRLMATALLLRGDWQINEETVFSRFSSVFGAQELCSQLSAIFWDGPTLERTSTEAEEPKRRAYEAVWLVEQLLQLLRRYVE